MENGGGGNLGEKSLIFSCSKEKRGKLAQVEKDKDKKGKVWPSPQPGGGGGFQFENGEKETLSLKENSVGVNIFPGGGKTQGKLLEGVGGVPAQRKKAW